MTQQQIAGHIHSPLTRTVLKLEGAGMPIAEIAWRLRRSPGHISRVLYWSTLTRPPQDAPPLTTSKPAPSVLRPLERTVLRAREAGKDRKETAAKLRRSPQHIARIEIYADTKLAGAS